MATDMLCLLLKQKTAIVRPGSLGFGRGVGQCRKIVWQGPVKKIRPKCMIWQTSDVIWGDLGTFWSDFNEFKMQNHSVIKCFVKIVNV